MKVLFLSRYQFPYVKSGGTGVVVYELMLAIRALGHGLEHWTWRTQKPKSVPAIREMVGFSPLASPRLRHDKLGNFFDIVLTNLSMIRRLERTRSFDVIHVHTWEMFLVGVVAKYLWKAPLVFTTHDMMQDDLPNEVNTPDIYEFGLFGEKALISEADAIVGVSEENRRAICKYYPQVRKKAIALPNGVNVVDFDHTEGREVFRKHEVSVESPYVFYIGRTVQAKGIESVITAAELVPDRIPFVFALSTKRWDGTEHKLASHHVQLVKSLAKRRRGIHLIVNEWDRQSVAQLYSHAAVTVMPSTYEPCGMVALESQACGTPVITNRIGFMQDCVCHDNTGILLALDEDGKRYARKLSKNIVRLCENVTERQRFGICARANVLRHHSWEVSAKKHLELYETLCGK